MDHNHQRRFGIVLACALSVYSTAALAADIHPFSGATALVQAGAVLPDYPAISVDDVDAESVVFEILEGDGAFSDGSLEVTAKRRRDGSLVPSRPFVSGLDTSRIRVLSDQAPSELLFDAVGVVDIAPLLALYRRTFDNDTLRRVLEAGGDYGLQHMVSPYRLARFQQNGSLIEIVEEKVPGQKMGGDQCEIRWTLDKVKILDNHEPWFKGDGEIYMHILVEDGNIMWNTKIPAGDRSTWDGVGDGETLHINQNIYVGDPLASMVASPYVHYSLVVYESDWGAGVDDVTNAVRLFADVVTLLNPESWIAAAAVDELMDAIDAVMKGWDDGDDFVGSSENIFGADQNFGAADDPETLGMLQGVGNGDIRAWFRVNASGDCGNGDLAYFEATGTHQAVDLEWVVENDSDVTGYRLGRATSAQGPFVLLTDTPVEPAPVNQLTDDALQTSQMQYYQLGTVLEGGAEVIEGIVSATPDGLPAPGPAPSPATEVEVMDRPMDSGRALDLLWTASADTDQHRILRRTANGFFLPVGEVSCRGTCSFTDTELTSGEYESYLIEAIDAGVSRFSSESGATPLNNLQRRIRATAIAK